MIFLAPWMLLGSIAAGVPIALHLLHRGQPKVRTWAAMDFLRKSLKDTSRRIKFRNLLLLAARVLICLLAALALARPTAAWLPSWSATEAVVVMDVSASMAARESGTTRMDLARREARTFLESLPTGSRARLIAVSDTIENESGIATAPARAAADLEAMTPSDRRGDIAAGLALAADHLRGSSLSSKALVIISDLQPSGWESGAGRIRQEIDRLPGGTALRVRRIGEPAGSNLQVLGAAPAAGFVLAGSRQLWHVRIKNGGIERATDVVVRLGYADAATRPDEAEATPLGNIAPGEERVAEVSLQADATPWRRVVARVTAASDRLDRDDAFYRVTRVRPRLNTLVVGAVAPRDKAVNLGIYWKQAIEAINPAVGATNFKVLLQTPESASNADLDTIDMVVLAGLPTDGGGAAWESLVGRLEPWVRRGGVVLAVPRASGVTKPSTWLAPSIAPGAAGTSHVDITSLAGSVLAPFALPPLDALGRVAIINPCRVEALQGGRVLARMNGGAGAITLSPLGDGTVSLIGLGSSPDEGDLVLHPLFVPLVQSVVSESVGRGESGRHTPWHWNGEMPATDLMFSGPQGLTLPARATPNGFEPEGLPRAAGFWTLAPRGSTPAEAPDFAHNLDAAEGTGWSPLPSARIDEILGRSSALDSSNAPMRAGGPEALGWILLVLLMVLLGEGALAWWSGRPA